jgi:microcystin-dependent protein
MKRFLCSLALLTCIAGVAQRAALAQASDPFLGEIQLFAFNFCPSGWLPLQGQLLPINQYAALFDLLGTTYGGDGIRTFALPKWGATHTQSGAAMTPCIATQGVFPSQN